MNTTKKTWDMLTEEQREKATKDIIDYFATEKDEEIGVIAAGELLDVFLQCAGLTIYNKGVEEARKFLGEKMEEASMEAELNLKKAT